MSDDFARTIASACGCSPRRRGWRRRMTSTARRAPRRLWAHYGERTDPQSAREMLAARLEAPEATAAEPEGEGQLEHIPGARVDARAGPAPLARSTPDAVADFLASRQGRAPQREIVRGEFGLLRKRL